MADEPGEEIWVTPDGYNVCHDRVTGETVRLTFYEGKRAYHMQIWRKMLPMFLRQLQQESGILPPEPLNPNDLEIGGVIGLAAHQVKRLPDGNVQLTLYMTTDDGGRIIPMTISPVEAATLANELFARSLKPTPPPPG